MRSSEAFAPLASVRRAPGRLGGRRGIALITAIVLAATATVAWAYWSASATAGSAGAAAASTVAQGSTPTATASATIGRTVTVSWGSTTLSNGHAVDGYIVKRYDAGTGVQQPTLSGCAGTVAATTCTETGVSSGSWKYTVTPVIGSNWQGAESPQSGAATVAPAALTLTRTLFGSPLPQTTTGSLTGFAPNEAIAYRLDSSPGTPLTGSPSSADTNGDATITSLTIPTATADGAHTVHALGNFSPVASQASAGILVDTTAPTVTASLSPAANGAGWNNTSSVTVTLSAADGTGSGVSQIKYTIDGSDPITSATAVVYTGPFAVGGTPPVPNSTIPVRYYAVDNAGNASAVNLQTVKIDTVAPVNGLSLTASSGGAFLTGTTLYYNGNNAGSFELSNSLSDTGGSGPASTGYPTLAGTSTGWTFSSSSVTAGPPYVSNAFSWSSGASSSPTEALTGADTAGNTSTSTLTFTPDTTAPAGGALSVNGTAASGAGSSSTSSSGSFSIGTRTDYTDVGSGLASSVLTVRSASFTSSGGVAAGTCGTFGSASTITGSPNQTGLATGCYQYTLTGTDNVGNTSSISTIVKVDTTAPSSPAVALSAATGNTFISGSTVYTNPQAGKSGSFTATATATDNDSGIASITLPTLTGFTAGGGILTTSPFTTTYNWNGAGATASGNQTATATNGVANTTTNNTAFTITPDTTAPGGGTFSYTATSNVLSPVLTLPTATDSGSGLNASTATVLRAFAPLTGNTTCGTFGSFTAIATSVSGTSYTDVDPTGGRCYQYEYQISDNVGNTATYSSANVVKAPPMPENIAATPVNPANDTPDPGDAIVLSYNEAMTATTICNTAGFATSATSGTTSSAIVTMSKGSAGSTTLAIDACPNVNTLTLGGVYLTGNGTGKNVTFGGSTVTLTSAGVLTIQLGSTLGGITTPAQATGSPFTDTWAPSASSTDPSGNGLVQPSPSLSVILGHNF